MKKVIYNADEMLDILIDFAVEYEFQKYPLYDIISVQKRAIAIIEESFGLSWDEIKETL